MSLTIVKATSTRIVLSLQMLGGKPETWWVDPRCPGAPGQIIAHNAAGETCTLGSFRTKDGTNQQPDYARLRRLCGFKS